MFCSSTKIAKRMHCCFNMATLNMFVLTATCLTIQMELFAFSWQQWLGEYAKMLLETDITSVVLRVFQTRDTGQIRSVYNLNMLLVYMSL